MRLAALGMSLLLGACSNAAEPEVEPAHVPSDSAFVETIRAADGTMRTTKGGEGRADALYQIGSISKYVCTLAILDLQAEGRVSLDATLAEVLPAYEGVAADRITVRDVLANRSGLVDGVMMAFRADPATADKRMPVMDAANVYGAGDVTFEPGAEFDYMITNWILAQAIIETVTGQPVEAVLQERVFGPAGTRTARSFVGKIDAADTVEPATPVPGMPDFLTCAGGIAATSADLLRLVRYPYHTERLGEAELGALTTILTEDEGYTLGGRVLSVPYGDSKHLLAWHTGSNGAFKSRTAYDPVTDTGIAIVTNDGDLDLLYDRTRAWIEESGGRLDP
ncbi:serine hydrolase domain-containing protein [Parvularcula sp. LCG005]|uniref:serine hydrolase domain-containing protein n=1 Tax=Parvularcula sp. LCG005 TaxID=3078805 RepID=UPI002941CBAA|nr:serine hydrolase domain-containing protein [Parvularcula sp. LCG005]WOI54227.1 serine hydrolase domain-containing protein [Parvularcula sp. LCG005]